jgi:2-polyprenyl-3-methyl-5-hydroxy-6-metoxy-1,4-benzoquinol methylase
MNKNIQKELVEKSQWNGKNYPNLAYQSMGGQPGVRDMTHRFNIMNLPDSFKGKTVIDIGCNAGAVCIEAKRRGAERVVGVDYMDGSINVAKKIADELSLDIQYFCFNLEAGLDSLKSRIGEEKFDYTFALSIWNHVDKRKLSNIINYYTKETCWFEGHSEESSAYNRPPKDHGKTKEQIEKMLNYNSIEQLENTTDRNTRLNFKLKFN